MTKKRKPTSDATMSNAQAAREVRESERFARSMGYPPLIQKASWDEWTYMLLLRSGKEIEFSYCVVHSAEWLTVFEQYGERGEDIRASEIVMVTSIGHKPNDCYGDDGKPDDGE